MKSINVDEMLLNPLTHAYLRKYIQLLNWNTDNCKLNVHYRFKELGSKELFFARADYISFTYGHRVKRCFSPFRQKNSRKQTETNFQHKPSKCSSVCLYQQRFAQLVSNLFKHAVLNGHYIELLFQAQKSFYCKIKTQLYKSYQA